MSGTEALARVLRSVGVEIGYSGADTYRTVVAERILADPGPLLAALAEAGILREEFGIPDGLAGLQRRTFGSAAMTAAIGRGAQVDRRYVTDWEATDA